jgi:hypothetical protein
MLGKLGLARGPTLRAEIAKTVNDGVLAELKDPHGTECAISLVVAAGKLGVRFADTRMGDLLLEQFFSILQIKTIELPPERWGDLLTAFVRLDVDVDAQVLAFPTSVRHRTDDASRYLGLMLNIQREDAAHRERADAARRELQTLIETAQQLGPRTRAHALAEVAGLYVLEVNSKRIPLLREAADLDPESPTRALELGKQLMIAGRNEDALKCLKRSVELFERIGQRPSVMGDETNARDLAEQIERDLAGKKPAGDGGAK